MSVKSRFIEMTTVSKYISIANQIRQYVYAEGYNHSNSFTNIFISITSAVANEFSRIKNI